MGTRRERKESVLMYAPTGCIRVPGYGDDRDTIIRSSSPPPFTSKWMSDAINMPPGHLGGGGDIGCQMLAYKTYQSSSRTTPFKVQGLSRIYEGRLFSDYYPQSTFTLPGVGSADFSDPSSLLAAGATAIARTIPTHPAGGAAVALGELRKEGLPRVPAAELIKLAKKQRDLLDRGFRHKNAGVVRPRDAGDEYLNLQFGWAPIVNDLRKFAKSIKHSNQILKQLHRDSGRNVRRRYEFPTTTDPVKVYADGPGWAYSPAMEGDLGRLDTWMLGDGPIILRSASQRSRKRWFAGCYTYYVPPLNDSSFFGDLDRYETYANKLLGTRLNPETVWNLAPWSWAADWFTNIGDVMTNISYIGQDGLAMRYGYVMETVTQEQTITWTGRVNLVGSPNTQITLVDTFGSQTMQRRYASPYGFGLTFEALTPRQQAITVALGLTRGSRN